MGKGSIGLDKIKEEAGIHYYFVDASWDAVYKFFIGVDPQKNRVLFFKTADFSTPINIIEFEDPAQIITIEGIGKQVSNYAAYLAYKQDFRSRLKDSI